MICPQYEEKEPDLERVDSPIPKGRVWKSCCLRCDKDVVVYLTKYLLLVGLMIFFSIELHIAIDCERQQLMSSLLTLVIGVALPNPRIK